LEFVCYDFLKKWEFNKNLKTTSNKKLLRATSQKIDFFLKERENNGQNIELKLDGKNVYMVCLFIKIVWLNRN